MTFTNYGISYEMSTKPFSVKAIPEKASSPKAINLVEVAAFPCTKPAVKPARQLRDVER